MRILSLLSSLVLYSYSFPVLTNSTGLYPRAIGGPKNILASIVSFDPQGYGGIYRSVDGGTTFDLFGTIRDPVAAGGLCCSTLFELPVAIGKLANGTLLWAASFGAGMQPKRMQVRAWSSSDGGKTWNYLSTIASTTSDYGLWEPEFSVDSQGRLWCFYSDETRPSQHSQLLVGVFTSDGLQWSAPVDIVAGSAQSLRPGMANVRKAAGAYFMTYEVCGAADPYGCAAHIRQSADGAQWGDPSELGAIMTDKGGRFFAHTPVLATSPDGMLVTAQMFMNADGTPSSLSGGAVFRGFPSTGWTVLSAPVPIPNPPNDYCPNYSPALLSLGSEMFEITSNYLRNVCVAYFGKSQTLANRL